MGKLHIGKRMGWVCEQRHRYVSSFFPFFSFPYTFIRHILYVRSLGYKKKKKKSKIESCPPRAYQCGEPGHTKKWQEIPAYSGANEILVWVCKDITEELAFRNLEWRGEGEEAISSQEVRKQDIAKAKAGGVMAGIKGWELRLLRCVGASPWRFYVLR